MTENRPSSTALYIAKKLVFASQEPGVGPLVPPAAAALSRRYVEQATPGGAGQLRAYEKPWFRALTRLVEQLTVPGMTLHYVVRKAHLEAIARRAIADGFEQIVVLGAGFDTLTERLRSEGLDTATLIEVDHPATQRVKVSILEADGVERPGVAFVPCALGREDLFECLDLSPEFDARRKTLFFAEGLLMYLEPADVDTLFARIRSAMKAETLFAFTFMEPQAGGRIAFGGQSRIVDLWLRWRGEPFRWAVPRGELLGFLSARGYGLVEMVDTAAFRRLYLEPRGLASAPLADGDHLCLAAVIP